jgi:2-desacetyl-2-hydroxyethyl bacteriochlorophyllide A dehydrogenase
MSASAVFDGPGTIRLSDRAEQSPAVGEAVVEVAACGICGTDRSIFRGEYTVEAPVVLGHEYAGTVVEVGADVDTLVVGQRVCIDPNITCGICVYCRRGLTHLCSDLRPLGIARDGGFARYSHVPARYAYPLPEHVSFEEGALVEPVACCLRGIQQAEIAVGDSVAVLGAGPIGSILLQLALGAGASRVAVVEPDSDRRSHATSLGADLTCAPALAKESIFDWSGGLGADIAIEASGRTAGAELALQLVRRGGRIVWFGVYPEAERLDISPYLVNENELTVRGSLNNPFTHHAALAVVSARSIQLKQLVSDRIGLGELSQALRGQDGYAGKVIVNPSFDQPPLDVSPVGAERGL